MLNILNILKQMKDTCLNFIGVCFLTGFGPLFFECICSSWSLQGLCYTAFPLTFLLWPTKIKPAFVFLGRIAKSNLSNRIAAHRALNVFVPLQSGVFRFTLLTSTVSPWESAEGCTDGNYRGCYTDNRRVHQRSQVCISVFTDMQTETKTHCTETQKRHDRPSKKYIFGIYTPLDSQATTATGYCCYLTKVIQHA